MQALFTSVDKQLIHLIAGGDEQAFDELYQKYSVAIYNYLLHLVRIPAEADDLLQEVFLAVWRGADQFRGQAQVKTWIFRIAHNLAVTWLRQQHNDGHDPYKEKCGEAGPEEIIVNTWLNYRVRQAIENLSDKHREAIELAFVQEMSYREIAEIVGCPVGTVKSRVSYALQVLDGELREMGFNGRTLEEVR